MQQIFSENPEVMVTCATEEANKYATLAYDAKPNKLLETTSTKTIEHEITQKVNEFAHTDLVYSLGYLLKICGSCSGLTSS